MTSPAKAICCPSFDVGEEAAAVGNTCVDTLYLRMLAYLAAILPELQVEF
jgi:hypothetical protein